MSSPPTGGAPLTLSTNWISFTDGPPSDLWGTDILAYYASNWPGGSSQPSTGTALGYLVMQTDSSGNDYLTTSASPLPDSWYIATPNPTAGTNGLVYFETVSDQCYISNSSDTSSYAYTETTEASAWDPSSSNFLVNNVAPNTWPLFVFLQNTSGYIDITVSSEAVSPLAPYYLCDPTMTVFMAMDSSSPVESMFYMSTDTSDPNILVILLEPSVDRNQTLCCCILALTTCVPSPHRSLIALPV